MPFDYKKEYRAFYQPPKVPEIIDVPEMQFVCVSGTGDPNEEGGAYQQALGVLYAVSYTLKMSPRAGHLMDGFFDYVVPPLEGFWQQDGVSGMDYERKADLHWLSVIRVPDFVTAEDFRWAVETASEKKKLDCSRAELRTIREGLCVQMMHIGAYDDEPASVAQMDAFLRENGYENDAENSGGEKENRDSASGEKGISNLGCCLSVDERHPFFSFVAWFHLLQRESRLRARQGGFAVAPLTPSQRTPMFLDFYCYRRNLRLQARLGQRCFWRFLRIFPLLDLDECGIILFRDEDEPRCAANFSFWLTRMKCSVASLRQVE